MLLGAHLHVTIKVLMAKVSAANGGPFFGGRKSRPMEASFEVTVTLFIITRDKCRDTPAPSQYREQWKHVEARILKITVKHLKWSPSSTGI